MGLSVTTIARNRRLTTIDRVKSVAGVDVTVDYIDRASAAIEAFCRRPFAREVYSETLPGFGDIHLQLRRTPVVSVSSVTDNSQVITDYSIAEAERGWLYRQNGWSWTAQPYLGLSGGGAFLDFGMPLPHQEEPTYAVAYTAGYFVPEDDYGAKTISASSVDNSFNDTASGFSTLLRSGDVIEVKGFETAANRGRFQVTGTPTAAKIIVNATLVTEAAGPDVTIGFRSLPADIEQAAIETIKTWYAVRQQDSAVVEKQAGPMRVRYAERLTGEGEALPPLAAALLQRWVRAA